jgi:hypothetical protein
LVGMTLRFDPIQLPSFPSILSLLVNHLSDRSNHLLSVSHGGLDFSALVLTCQYLPTFITTTILAHLTNLLSPLL